VNQKRVRFYLALNLAAIAAGIAGGVWLFDAIAH
jgi:hypothetical protein